jgi:recombinational DNA repair protein RecR
MGAIICAAAIPFQLTSQARSNVCWRRRDRSLIVVVRSKRPSTDTYSDEYGQLQAAAWAGMYFVLNVHVIEGW